MKRKLALLIASTVLIGSVIGGSTFALFTATSGPATASLSSGTLAFTITDQIDGDDDQLTDAIIYVEDMAPGDTRSSVAKVHSTGSLPLIYRFLVNNDRPTAPTAADTALEQWLQVRFYQFVEGAGSDTVGALTGGWVEFGDYSAFPAQAPQARTLNQWYSTANPDYQGELAPGGTEYIKIEAHLPLATPNPVQGGTAVFRINANATQKNNHGLTVNYYSVTPANNFQPTTPPILTRIDPDINYTWDQTRLLPGGPYDYVHIAWTGKVQLKAGTTQFRTLSDDGVRLWVDNLSAPLIDNWSPHSNTYNTASFIAPADGWYDIKMTLFEQMGFSTSRLEWYNSNTSSWEVVPQQFFKP